MCEKLVIFCGYLVGKSSHSVNKCLHDKSDSFGRAGECLRADIKKPEAGRASGSQKVSIILKGLMATTLSVFGLMSPAYLMSKRICRGPLFDICSNLKFATDDVFLSASKPTTCSPDEG